jgi:hypothetical protein
VGWDSFSFVKQGGIPCFAVGCFLSFTHFNQCLSQVLFEKYLQGVATTDNIEKFFSSVCFEQASRAARNELPYRYQELLTKWDTSFKGMEGHSLDNSNQAFDKKVIEAVKRVGGSLTPTKFDNNPKRTKQSPWCVLFNTNSGCTNTQRSGGCTDQAGVEYKHGCNVRGAGPGGRMCNSAQHSRLNH